MGGDAPAAVAAAVRHPRRSALGLFGDWRRLDFFAAVVGAWFGTPSGPGHQHLILFYTFGSLEEF